MEHNRPLFAALADALGRAKAGEVVHVRAPRA
jgi:hypothetical protein